MASAEIALECGLKVRAGCQDRLYMNSDTNETLAQGFPNFLFMGNPLAIYQFARVPPNFSQCFSVIKNSLY